MSPSLLQRGAALLALAVLAASSAPAYTLTGSHWYTATIPMQLQLGASTTALSDGTASWGAAAEDALSTWNSNIGVTRFTVVRDSTATIAQGNRLNNVLFSKDVYGDAWGSGVLAVTLTYTTNGTQTVECDVLFNQTLKWDSYRGALRYGTSGTIFDFHRVALHEFGHVLGLDHPDQAGQSVVAVMNSRVSNLDALASDDIAGAQSIYSANLSSSTAPAITSQPASQSVVAGSNVTFSVSATSGTAMNYQWWKDSVAVPGATTATLSLPNVATSAAGQYWATVSNSVGSTTSSVATLTVTTPVVAPSITSQPASRTAAPGTAVTFSVTATGSAPLTYAWRKNGAAISAATQSSYTLGAVQAGDAGNYTVIVSNSAGSVTSNVATLTVSAAPAFSTQPTSQAVNVGSNVSFSVSVSGTPAPTLQWYKDGTLLSGATTTVLTLNSVGSSDAGTYTARAVNGSGSATSNGAVLTVNTPPAITTAPVAQTVASGERIALAVAASGSPAPAYQWQKNGAPIAGATQSTYVIAAAAPSDSGNYAVVLTNTAGTVSTVPVTVTVRYSQLVNLSARGFVPAGGALTAGFVVRGAADKALVVRGVGPALAAFGVSNPLADPQLVVLAQDTAQTLATNDSWSASPQLSTDFQSVGAFPLPAGSADAASAVRLMPGPYTTRITSGTWSGSGVALAEVYDAEANSARSRLINLSILGYAGADDSTLVAGFTVQGNAPKRLLLRAIGPGLAPYNVMGTVADPRLDLFPLGQSTATAGNDNWGGTAELKAAFTTAGAFTLNDASRDAAMVLSVNPGSYTAVVTGVSGTGYVLVEIYDLDP